MRWVILKVFMACLGFVRCILLTNDAAAMPPLDRDQAASQIPAHHRDMDPVPATAGKLAEFGTQVACGSCLMKPLCHLRGVARGAPTPVSFYWRLERGGKLYTVGSPRDRVYALRAGFLKVVVPDANGGHIVRFLLPGDVAALDAFAGGVHVTEAVALDDCEVCVIPAERLDLLAACNTAVGKLELALLAAGLADADCHGAAVARMTASQRVARFLLDLSRRWGERGFSARRFRLPMGRREIGDHLGLTMETVSRVLSDFRERGLIALPRNEVEIRTPDVLLDETRAH
jgi:CRP/FNR family transcriptional regulator, anaerobic regulatory protein